MLREIIVKAREVIASHKSRLSEIDSLLARNPKNPSVRSLLRHERETKTEETRRLESLVAEAEELEGVRSLRAMSMISSLEKTYAYEWLNLERLIERDRPRELPGIRVAGIARTLPPLINDDVQLTETEAALLPSQNAAADGSRTDEANRAETAAPALIATDSEEVFTPNDDYTLIKYRGETYILTASAGKVVRVLHEAYKEGKGGMSYAEVRRHVKCGKVWDQFKRRDGRKFWTAFIKNEAKDVLRLNFGASPD